MGLCYYKIQGFFLLLLNFITLCFLFLQFIKNQNKY